MHSQFHILWYQCITIGHDFGRIRISRLLDNFVIFVNFPRKCALNFKTSFFCIGHFCFIGPKKLIFGHINPQSFYESQLILEMFVYTISLSYSLYGSLGEFLFLFSCFISNTELGRCLAVGYYRKRRLESQAPSQYKERGLSIPTACTNSSPGGEYDQQNYQIPYLLWFLGVAA